ncbi:hypothetical protein FGG08_004346 [Glutinoglossum americanum]|uniref:Zinc/iron permease n=1 Tax=Glutinoglossum americanum TaxID=1670608 RepID=A0A9P8I7R9_9PEZI|nr:hypothetical protein FGG08_004346 [Glutinoglossum americanum]
MEDVLLWAEIPTAILRAELLRRQDSGSEKQPACGSRHAKGSYNTPLHVGALILVLVLSTLACSFPIIVRRFPSLPVPHHFLFLSRHFGTGVLIATAFVHLLPTAFTSLTDSCLPPFWNQRYRAMPGLIAMVSVLAVVGIEMFFATRGAGHVHGSEYDTVPDSDEVARHGHQESNGGFRPRHRRQESLRRFRQGDIGLKPETGEIALGDLPGSSEHLMSERSLLSGAGSSPLPGRDPKYKDTEEEDEGDEDLDLDELDPSTDTSGLLNQRRRGLSLRSSSHERYRPRSHSSHHHAETGGSPIQLSDQQQQQKMLLQCLLLEAGILFHSVFIGMALSVATGTSFIVLLVAISFHQTFEGIALGSRIASITSFSPTSPKPWLMALAYGLTTPLGQAIGLLIHNLYDPASQTGLLMVGVMNAISSGLLLFAGLVELLAEDFLSDKSYEVLKGKRRGEACGAVVAGAFLMAFVGAWA